MLLLPCSARFVNLLAAGILFCIVLLFADLYSRPMPHHGIQLPPAEFFEIRDRYPALRQVERDLASGRTKLSKAIDMVEPLIEGRTRRRTPGQQSGKGHVAGRGLDAGRLARIAG